MKKLFVLFTAIVFVSNLAFAQETKDSDQFKVDKSKLFPKMTKLAITELTVNYKLTTTAKTITQEKSSKDIAGARVSAYLEITDGDLTRDDCQKITNHFYSYFQKRLKAGGIDTVGWNQMIATDFYTKISDDEDKEEADAKQGGGGNEWITATANKGKIVHSGKTGFAGGKGKRSVEFVKDLDAIAASFKLVIDFADVIVNLDLKTKEAHVSGDWYTPAVTTKKYTWAINPEMRIGDPDNTWTYIWGNKGWPEFVLQWNDIPSPGKYADSMTEDVSKARSGVAKQFAFRKELTPVLIQTTREKYITAAKKACEKYADAFVERVNIEKGK